MAITKGTILGPYEILAHIGAGGMGEVWRARDKRIGRDVAVKVLPHELGTNNDYVRRFEQEARAAGALNHPGLVTIFDVGTLADGAPYLVMELLEGENLRDALGDTTPVPLPLRRTIDYAIQIASALAVAHEKGIIHRDLKPENIFVTAEGRVKILDFGLAKLTENAPDADDHHLTARRHLTSTGMVVGTPGYMSPEQVRAKPLDYRTDIFSFGAVLYEMLCGYRAFDRDSAVETMTSVLNDEPAPLATDIPPALEAIVRHCMEKNPRERFQSARDLAFQLRTLTEFQKSRTDQVPSLNGEETKRRLPYRAGAVVLALLALAGAEYAFLSFRGGVAAAPPRTFKQLTFADGQEMYPTLAPDGKSFAYVSAESGNRDIYVQRVDGLTATNVTADSPDNDSQPAFSPDGSQIAFRSERDGGGIFIMGVTGESVRRLTDFGYTPSWSPDGAHIVVATEDIEYVPASAPSHSELWVIDTRSGARRQLLKSEGRGDKRANNGAQPSWSPNGKRIAYWGVSDSSGHRDLSTIDPSAPRPSETVVAVTSDAAFDWNPVWSADGKSLYFGSDRDGTTNLWRIAIDEASGKPEGAPEPLSLPATFAGHFAVSRNEIVFATILPTSRLIAFPFDQATGKTAASKTLMAGSQEILSFRPSPDERFLAYTTGGTQEDLFVANIDGTHRRQLTNDVAKDRGVIWSPDGKTLYFYSNRSGTWDVWSIRADGSALARVGNDEEYRRLGIKSAFISDVSPDGRTLCVQTDSSPALIHLDRAPGQRVERLSTTASLPANFPVWSPDGTKLAAEIPFAGVGIYSFQTHRFEKVSDHGSQPAWLPDGHRITYLETNDMAILDLQTGKTTTAPIAPEMHLALIWLLSKDGTTLYVRQSERRGDIWMMRMETP